MNHIKVTAINTDIESRILRSGSRCEKVTKRRMAVNPPWNSKMWQKHVAEGPSVAEGRQAAEDENRMVLKILSVDHHGKTEQGAEQKEPRRRNNIKWPMANKELSLFTRV